MSISKQQLTPIVDKLVESSFVQREHDANDRRTVNISLTTSGKQFLEGIHNDAFQFIKTKIQVLEDNDLISLHKSLKEIYRVMSKII